jgi:hypothetical protein
MSTTTTAPQKKFRSYVPDNTTMPEFTLRAVLLGLVLTVILLPTLILACAPA